MFHFSFFWLTCYHQKTNLQKQHILGYFWGIYLGIRNLGQCMSVTFLRMTPQHSTLPFNKQSVYFPFTEVLCYYSFPVKVQVTSCCPKFSCSRGGQSVLNIFKTIFKSMMACNYLFPSLLNYKYLAIYYKRLPD